MSHFTPIASGAAANAATFNAPMEELSDAIDAASITPAPGTVTATELAASVAGNGLAGGAGTVLSVNVDGTTVEISSDALRVKSAGITATQLAASVAGAGLVGGAGTALAVNPDGATLELNGDLVQVKNLGIGGAKIARDAFAPPNVFVDATFQTTPLKIAAEWGINGHTFRWHPRGQTSLDDTAMLVFDDTANPMGVRQRTLRFKGASVLAVFGWYISLAEAGWKAGDVVSGVVYGLAAAGTFAMNVRCYNAAGTALGSSQTGTGLAYSGTAAAISISGATIDATAAYVLFYVSRTAGTSDFDLYWRHAGPGLLIPQVPSGQGYLPQMGVPRKRDADGSHLLPDYSAQASKILSADGTSQLDVVYLSDSWGQKMSITTVLRTWLQATYGDAGLGWVSFYVTFNQGSSYWEGLAASPATQRTGTWIAVTGDVARTAGAHGPDITHTTTFDAAMTMKFTTTVTFTAIDILTYKATAGGTYEYRIDGGSWVPVSTAGAAAVLVTSITGLSAATHVVEFQVNTIGTDGLTFLGLNLKKSGNGARLHRLAITSSTAAHWAAVNATDWQAGLAVLAPHLVIPSLATNDKTANTPPQTQAASLATIISRIWAVRSLTDILLFTPCDVTDSGGTTYTSAQYASAQRTLASSLDIAYGDGFALMPVNADSISRGMCEALGGGNSRHLTPAGGRYFANFLIQRFLKVP